MPTEEKIKGPASYFPSIEKKYGQPITHWLELVGNLNGMKHMEMVDWLKTEHNMGHGHANAIIAYYLQALKNSQVMQPNTSINQDWRGLSSMMQFSITRVELTMSPAPYVKR